MINDYELSNEDLIILISNLNSEIKNELFNDINNPKMYLSLKTLLGFNIIDDRLDKFYYMCCYGNMDILYDTLLMFRLNIFKDEDINNNLDSIYPIEFIDHDIYYERIKNNLNTKEYIHEVRKAFNLRYIENRRALKKIKY